MTHKKRILELLKSGQWITNRELNEIGFRYGAVLHELRNEGYDISTRQVKKGLYEYRLVDNPLFAMPAARKEYSH